MVTIDITDEQGWKTLCLMRHQAKLAGKQLKADLGSDKPITEKQVSSLHIWCREVAKCLQDAGLDMKAVTAMEIPATEVQVKEVLYKPVLKALTGKLSTMDQDTVEPSQVAEVIARHFATTYGIVLPVWPSRHG